MTGLTIPSMKIFFTKRYIWRLPGYTWAKKEISGTLFRLIQQYLAIARCIQVYERCIPKKNFLPQKDNLFSYLYLFMLEKDKLCLYSLKLQLFPASLSWNVINVHSLLKMSKIRTKKCKKCQTFKDFLTVTEKQHMKP